MADFRTDLQCGRCERSFSVELTKMRLNLKHACPFCGFECRVSQEQAIQAHRALDELQHIAKCTYCVEGRAVKHGPRAATLHASAACACLGTSLDVSAIIDNYV